MCAFKESSFSGDPDSDATFSQRPISYPQMFYDCMLRDISMSCCVFHASLREHWIESFYIPWCNRTHGIFDESWEGTTKLTILLLFLTVCLLETFFSCVWVRIFGGMMGSPHSNKTISSFILILLYDTYLTVCWFSMKCRKFIFCLWDWFSYLLSIWVAVKCAL